MPVLIAILLAAGLAGCVASYEVTTFEMRTPPDEAPAARSGSAPAERTVTPRRARSDGR